MTKKGEARADYVQTVIIRSLDEIETRRGGRKKKSKGPNLQRTGKNI